MLKHALFVPNDTHMDNRDDTVAIITGPNICLLYTSSSLLYLPCAA